MITLDLSILNQKGTPMFYSDTLALRPAFGIAGRIFIDTASPYGIYRDTGSAWVQIAGSAGGGIGGSGTATQIAFFSAATTLTSSANLFWDNTNARLGVNTNTPTASLDIHSTIQSVIQANNTTLGNSFLSFQLQGTGKWQIGNVYNAGANYFRIQDQLNSLERLKIQNTGQIDQLGWIVNNNTLTGITGTSPTALVNSAFSNNFTFNSGITTSASVNVIGLLMDNNLAYSGANTINATSYNASGLYRNALNFGSAGASVTYTQASSNIRALVNNQIQYLQNGANSGTISHYANIQILGDQKTGAGLTTFTNRYGLLINDYNEFSAGNTYTNRWGIYQAGFNESNFFAGKVGIGSGYTPGTFQLDVIGTTRVSANCELATTSTGFSGLKVGGSGNQNYIIIDSTQNTELRFAINGTTQCYFRQFQANEFRFNSNTGITSLWNVTDNSFLFGNANLVGSADLSSVMELRSTNKGFLPPRMTTAQKNAISSPVAGLVVYDTTLNKLCVYTTAWQTITSI